MIGVISNIVTIQVDGPVAQNEICYITTGGDRLMAEVIQGGRPERIRAGV